MKVDLLLAEERWGERRSQQGSSCEDLRRLEYILCEFIQWVVAEIFQSQPKLFFLFSVTDRSHLYSHTVSTPNNKQSGYESLDTTEDSVCLFFILKHWLFFFQEETRKDRLAAGGCCSCCECCNSTWITPECLCEAEWMANFRMSHDACARRVVLLHRSEQHRMNCRLQLLETSGVWDQCVSHRRSCDNAPLPRVFTSHISIMFSFMQILYPEPEVWGNVNAGLLRLVIPHEVFIYRYRNRNNRNNYSGIIQICKRKLKSWCVNRNIFWNSDAIISVALLQLRELFASPHPSPPPPPLSCYLSPSLECVRQGKPPSFGRVIKYSLRVNVFSTFY